MISAYRQAVAFLESLTTLEPGRPRDRGGPDAGAHTRDLLSRLGDPHLGPRFIHVGGTSGKGSTVMRLHRIFHAAGLPVMSFTSPHLTTTLERIAFKGGLLPPEVFVTAANTLRPAINEAHARGRWGAPRYFDALFALCLVAARSLGADPIVLEVGLGGTLDATNQIGPPVVAAVTDVGLDHTHILGGTVEVIARDKAGIFKAGSRALTSAQRPEALRELQRRADEVSIRLGLPGVSFDLRPLAGGGWQFTDALGALPLPDLTLSGEHQRRNVALAIAVARQAREGGIPVADEAIAGGLRDGFLPGRMERAPGPTPVVLDIAHNPDKARAFAETFAQRYGIGHTAVVGVAREKDLVGILGALAGGFRRLIATRPLATFRPFWSPREIAEAARDHFSQVDICVDPWDGLCLAQDLEGPDGAVAVTGSTFLVGELRARWQDESQILTTGRLTPLIDAAS